MEKIDLKKKKIRIQEVLKNAEILKDQLTKICHSIPGICGRNTLKTVCDFFFARPRE